MYTQKNRAGRSVKATPRQNGGNWNEGDNLKERPSADRLFVYVTFRDLKHFFVLLSHFRLSSYSSTPLPPNRVVAIQPCAVDVILEVFLIAVISKDKERVAVAMAVCKIFYHCVLGTFSFSFLLKLTRPNGFAISRSSDLRLSGSSNALIRLRRGIRLRLGLSFGSTYQCYFLRRISPQ